MSESHATTPQRTARRGVLPRVRTLVMSTLGALGVLLLALSGVGGSYALWNDSASLDAGTINTGTADLTAAWANGHADSAWANLLPGESVRQPLTLTNTGAAPLELSVTIAGVAGFELRTVSGDCPGTQLAGAAANGTARSLGVTLDPGTTTTACIEVRATTAAAPGHTLAFSAQFDGTQVAR